MVALVKVVDEVVQISEEVVTTVTPPVQEEDAAGRFGTGGITQKPGRGVIFTD